MMTQSRKREHSLGWEKKSMSSLSHKREGLNSNAVIEQQKGETAQKMSGLKTGITSLVLISQIQ